MQEKIFLSSGERYILEDFSRLAIVESGKIEVYAVTRAENSFRKQFLIELTAESAAFPSLDEFEQVEFLIFAVEDTQIKICRFEEILTEKLKFFMQKWFGEMIKISWLELLANKGDDTLIKWREKNFIDDADDLLKNFRENEGILSMLIGARFHSEDKKFLKRVQRREKNQKHLVDDAISNLFGEEKINFNETLSENEKIEDVTSIVWRVAKFFEMPTENIKISHEMTKKLDSLRILRRLMQKGNMQMRLVTLAENWHKKDSGVLIGYFEKNLAVFLPSSPGNYKIFTRNFYAKIS